MSVIPRDARLVGTVRTFREKSILANQMAVQERLKGRHETAARFQEQAAQAEQYSALIVGHILQGHSSASVG